MTKEEFLSEMNPFAQFYEKQLSDLQTRVWYQRFTELDLQQFHNALIKHIDTDLDSRFPSIGKVKSAVYKPYKGGC